LTFWREQKTYEKIRRGKLRWLTFTNQFDNHKSIGALSDKYHSDAKWFGKHNGIIHFRLNLIASKAFISRRWRAILNSRSVLFFIFIPPKCQVLVFTLTVYVQVGVSFRKNGVWPSLYDVVVSLLRLQTPTDCIPHPYWMYTKYFSTLRCCGWAYGGTLMSCHYMCRWGGDFRENGGWPSLYDVAVTWLRLQTPIDCIPHLYWMYTKCFSTWRCCGWAYGCIPML